MRTEHRGTVLSPLDEKDLDRTTGEPVEDAPLRKDPLVMLSVDNISDRVVSLFEAQFGQYLGTDRVDVVAIVTVALLCEDRLPRDEQEIHDMVVGDEDGDVSEDLKAEFPYVMGVLNDLI